MNFQVTEDRGVVIAALEGQVRISTQNEFYDHLNGLFKSYAGKTVILDMKDVAYMNSAGIGIVVDTFRMFREVGGRMVLSGLSPDISRLFEMTKLNRFIEIFPSVDDAVAKLMV